MNHEDKMKYRKPFNVQLILEIDEENIDKKITMIETNRQSEESELKGAVNRLDDYLESWKCREKSGLKNTKGEYERIWRKINRHIRRLCSLNSQLVVYKDIKEGSVPAVPKPRSDRFWSKDSFLDMLLDEEYERTKNFSEEEFQEDMCLRDMYG
jgi:hypothetical protein